MDDGEAAGREWGERPLAPRVHEFARRVTIPTVSIMGKKQSGKTMVLSGLIRELVKRGRRVAALKHDTHGFAIDVPGTDTHALREAGAALTLIASPTHVALMTKLEEPLSLEQLVARIHEPVDLVLTEGFARGAAPKIEVSRAARSTSLIGEDEELLAVATDHAAGGGTAPRFGLEDYEGMADLLERLLEDWPAVRES